MTTTTAGDHRQDRHEVARSALLFLVLTALFLWPAVVRGGSFTTMGGTGDRFYPWFDGATTPVPVQADQAVLSAPWQAELNRAIDEGTLPLWGQQFGGVPLFANAASGQLYPPRLLIGVLGLSPLPAHDLFSALHLFGAGLAMSVLLRELRIGVAAARFGGAAWMLCGFNLAWLHFEVLTPVMVLLPLSMFAVRRAIRIGGAPPVVLAGTCIAVTLAAGQLPFMALTAFVVLLDGGVTGLVAGFRARSQGWREAARPLLRPVVAGALGVAGAAVVLLPTAATLAAGNRDPVEFEQLDDPWVFTGKPLTLDVSRLLDAVVPDSEALSVGSINHGQVFVGTLTVLLAAVGACARRRGQATGIAMVVGMPLLTIGGPLTWVMFQVNPLFRYFRPYGRATGILAFGLVILGSIGLDVLLAALGEDRRHAIGRWRFGASEVVAWSVLAITSVQLLVHGHDLNPTFLRRGEQAMDATPLVREVQAQQRRDPWPARMASVVVAPGFVSPLPGDTPLLFGIESTNGYDSSVPARTVAVARYLDGATADEAMQGLQDPYITNLGPGATRVELAERLGIRTFVTAPASPAPVLSGPGGRARTVEAVYEGTDGSLFRIADAAEPVRVVYDVVPADDEVDAFDRFFDPDFDWEGSVVVEPDELASSALAASLVGGGVAGDPRASAVATDVGVNTVRIRVDTEVAGIVVLPSNWDAGWRATVDGRPAEVLRVNYDQQAVAVPAGAVDVRLRYVPDGLPVGRAVTDAAIGVGGLAVLVHGIRRRRTRIEAA